MLEVKVIEPTEAEWAAPIRFAPMGDGSLRFCLDYQKLNTVTEQDSYFISRIDECIDSLGYALKPFALDATSGFWQKEIEDTDWDQN